MTGAIHGSTKKEPIVVGKPSGFMLDNIANTFKLKKEEICMVSRLALGRVHCRKSMAFRQISSASVAVTLPLLCFACTAFDLPSCCAKVGDRLDTDILFGKNGGLTTLLVFTGGITLPFCDNLTLCLDEFPTLLLLFPGVTDEETLLSPKNNIHPDYYTTQLSDLLTAKDSLKVKA